MNDNSPLFVPVNFNWCLKGQLSQCNVMAQFETLAILDVLNLLEDDNQMEVIPRIFLRNVEDSLLYYSDLQFRNRFRIHSIFTPLLLMTLYKP